MPPRPVSRRDRPAKAPLSREAILAAALVILRAEGLEKVTMRRIAAALETGPASLYVYVRDTRDLHALILDALLADLPAPKPGRRWRADLLQVAEAFLEVLMRYPEIARLTMSTLVTGPNHLRLLDTVAGLLLAGGADDRTAAWGVDLLLAYVVATAVEHGGQDRRDAEDAARVQELIANLDSGRYPHLRRVRDDLLSGEGPARFRWAVDAIVTGLLASGRG